MKKIDFTNKKIGKLKIIRCIGKTYAGTYLWECLCDCGNKAIVKSSHLKENHTRSCGCWNIKKIIERNTTHNMARTRFYKIWKSLKERCNNVKNTRYLDYGGRGINCQAWEKFDVFKKDMYKSYQIHCIVFGEKQTSIDRINNDSNYCKENCRWANYIQQANNRRKRRTGLKALLKKHV